MTFEVGDKVIYPNHGLGIVERIEEKTILGTTCGFYHLRIVANETTVLVPVSNVDGVGLRRAISDEDVERLFGLLGDGKIDNHQNWKGRFKDNSDKMRSGSIYEVADVLKSLTFLAKSKSLSFREKRMLDRAKFLIISEVSEVMRETAAAIEGRVDHALERCFSTKARTAARAVAKVTKPCADASPPSAPRAQAAVARRRAVRHAPRRRPAGSQSGRTSRIQLTHLKGPLADISGPFRLSSPRCSSPPVRSLVTYLAVSLYVLILGPIGMVLALHLPLEGPALHPRASRREARAGVLRHQVPSGGARARARGRRGVLQQSSEQRRSAGAVRRASPADAHPLQAEMNKIPILARAFRLGGFIPVDRRNKEAAMRAIEKGARSIKSGNSFLIFPEGTRSKTAELLPFKKGGFIMAIKAQAPIVPVAISGGRDAMRRGSRLVYPVTIQIRVGAPIATAGLTLDERDGLIERTRAAIEALLAVEAIAGR